VNPQLYIIAGPNGAGKTTFAGLFLPLYTQSREFVNADNIARRLSPENPEKAAFRAGREMLERINLLTEQRADFSLETTLSGKSYVAFLRKLKTHGYEIHLYFLWLPDVQISINRVADRVRKGGHNVPEPIIRRRYTAGINNMFTIYRRLMDSWSLFDNSLELPYLIAREKDSKLMMFDSELFNKCSTMATKPIDVTLQESFEMPDWMPALIALRLAKAQVVEEHHKTGHPLIIWRDGKVYRQPPAEAKRVLENALKNDRLASASASCKGTKTHK
jgi:predicted ABC-type ATPase